MCAILDSFHFLEPGGDDAGEAGGNQPAAAEPAKVPQDAAAGAGAAGAADGPTRAAAGAPGGAAEAAAAAAEGAEGDEQEGEGEGEEAEGDGDMEAVEVVQVPREAVYHMLLK